MKKRLFLWILAPLALTACSFEYSNLSQSQALSNSGTGSSSSDLVSVSWDSSQTPSSTGSSVSVDTSVTTTISSTSVSASGYTGTIALKDGASTFTGSNIAVNGNVITVSAKGLYLVSGTLTDGTILITADDDDTVELDLNGVSISRSGTLVNAPIYSANGEKLKIKKMADTVNTITDKRTSTTSSGEDKAAIFSNKKLEVVGSGTLTVVGTFNNGIASDTKVEAKNGTLNISASNNGIKAHKSILLGDPSDLGNVYVTSTAGDGLKIDEDQTADLDPDEFAGVKLVEGTYSISGYDDGIDSAANIYLAGGTGIIKATTSGTRTSDTGSKALVSTLSTYLSGGDYSIASTSDDGVHSNADVTISGGTYSISAGDDGIHAEGTLAISGGTTSVTKSYEGLEALNIAISGGTNSVTSSDDGMNAAGGSDSTGNDWGGGTVSTGATPTLTISGGYNYVAASGDGLDSNGNLIVTGGFTVVSQSGKSNGPLDYGDGGSYYCKQSGGFLAAYGTYDMAVGSTGTQFSILSTWSSVVSTSQYLIVTNSGGSFAIKPQYAGAYSLYISDSSFKAGSVTIARASSISGGSEKFKGVYTGYTASNTTAISSGTWNSTSVNIIVPDEKNPPSGH